MTFPDRLQEVMNEKGFTKYRVAKALDMSATTISNYLNSVTKPDSTKLEVLSRLLGVNRLWLLTGEGEKYRKDSGSIESYPGELSVREEENSEKQRLMSIIDKQAGSLRVKDEQVGKLIEMNQVLLNKLTPLLEKLIGNL